MSAHAPNALRVAALGVCTLLLGNAATAQHDVAELTAQAEQGDATAQFNLGRLYATGTGVPLDDVEAARWDRRAADQAHAGAQYGLELKYENGTGVPEDLSEAAQW